MFKTRLVKLLNFLNINIISKELLGFYSSIYGFKDLSVSLPLLPIAIISSSAKKEINEKLSSEHILENLPEKNQLPVTELLNWRPELDSSRTKASALDYRAYISSNQYTKWFGSKFMAKIMVNSGRVYWRQETMRQLRQAEPKLFHGKVLEVGAGTGLTSCEISSFSEVKEIFCLDYDEYTVENLMPLVQWSLGADATKVKRVIGSYNKMNVPAATFDCVVAVGSMHHSEDLDATMKECFRVLRAGGKFVVSDFALTCSLTQEEYHVLTELPLDESDATAVERTGDSQGVETNKTISEHERPLFVYLSAAFNAGFNVKASFFDATRDNGGTITRVLRRARETFKRQPFYRSKLDSRVLGYDQYRNVRSFSLFPRIRYPAYAKKAPSLLNLILQGDSAGFPEYDNMVLVLEKPEPSENKVLFKYPSGKTYQFSVNI